ncbi:HET-domain-containing protein [Pyrenochaeta sp. DS3sAY3a]|nr:HET-domain-containing protein [Pyrenochaeta sp. DS3sAY3a]
MMFSQTKPFVYTPLQPGEIRLLYPDLQENGRLHWLLKIAQLEDKLGQRTSIEFEALSYTWGDLSHTYPIVCNNQELQVHHNLNIALPFLARRDSQLPIWIDAVCINQADEDEKMKQIRLMISIYSAASQVWVWFGPGNKESGTVIRMLPEVIDTISDDFEYQISVSPKIMTWLASDEAWSSFYDLVENRWFSRLWVYQETAFARRIRVLLGDNEVSWDMLQRLINPQNWHFAGIDGQEPREVSNWAGQVFFTRQVTQKALRSKLPLPIEDAANVLMCTMRSFCFDPRDRIFGLLGYMTIQVADDASIEQMYTQFTRSILLNLSPESHSWWELLHWASKDSRNRPGLPSWCPDFHDVEGRSNSERNVIGQSASRRKTTVQRDYDLTSKELVVRGQIFDIVETVLEEYYEDEDKSLSERFHNLHSWEESTWSKIISTLISVSARRSQVYGDKEAIELAYWSTLLDGVNIATNARMKRIMEQLPYESLSQFRQGQYPALQSLENMELLEMLPFEEENWRREDFPDLMKHLGGVMAVVNNLEGSRLFITAEGRIGRGSPHIKAGDCVCILSYAKVAHVIRRTSDTGQTSYNFIGSAYVHGMMNGEVEDLDVEEVDIILE